MKNSIVGFGLLLMGLSPLLLQAQQTKTPSRVVLPEVEVKANNNLPSQVRESFLKEYGEGHKPLAWVLDNSDLKAETDKELKIFQYTLRNKASNGSSLVVSYSPDGKRLNSKEYLKNFAPGNEIINTLRNSEYTDWALKRNIMVRRVVNGGQEKERSYLTLQKGKTKKTLCFDENGIIVFEKRGQLAEAAW